MSGGVARLYYLRIGDRGCRADLSVLYTASKEGMASRQHQGPFREDAVGTYSRISALDCIRPYEERLGDRGRQQCGWRPVCGRFALQGSGHDVGMQRTV